MAAVGCLTRWSVSLSRHRLSQCSTNIGVPMANRRLSSRDLPNLSVAIVGAGPSGFYTAKYLQHSYEHQDESTCQIDILDRLPTPFGLVRSGVAPDHPEVKNVQHDFENVMSQNQQTIQYFGNVHVGRHVQLDELLQLYDAVVLAYGSASDTKLQVKGADHLIGVLSAREFVAWYNGHPDFVDIGQKVASVLNEDSHVLIVGQGNVALDCARILAKGTKGSLYDTDLASHSIPVLGDGVAQTTILGRRGHVQGAFTIKV